MQKKLEYFIKILIGASFFVPLLVFPSDYIFPFIVPKIVWFRCIVLLMLGSYLLLLASNWSKYRIRWNLLNIFVGLFFASFAVSTFVGVDWYRSFWDNHERMLGLFTIFHYVIYYFIITSVIRGWNEWKWLLRTFLFAGSIVMFIGLLQKADPEFLLNRGSDRVSATLGNSIYFSGYGLFLVFIGFLLAIKESVKKENFWFWYAVAGSILGFWGVFGGGTRGALLGLVAGLGVLLISYLFALKNHKRIKQILGGLIILGVVIAGLLFGFRQTNFVKTIPAVGRLVNTEISNTNTRVMAWGIAVDAWQEKPVFGWGPNNYYYAFNKYYRPEFLEHGYGETWFDNAHSVIMNTLAVQGGFGIITYLGIFIAAILLLWKGYRKGELDVHIASMCSAFLVAHLVSLVTVFDNPTSYLYFFFFLAFVSASLDKKELQIEKKTSKNISIGLAVVVSLVVLLMIYSTNINPSRANQATLNVIKVFNTGQDIFNLYDRAVGMPTPHVDDIRNDVGRMATNVIIQLAQNNKVSEALQLFELVRSELQKNLELHPMDIRVHFQLAQVYTIGAQLKQDMALMLEADKILEEALQKSPKRQQLQYTLSNIKMQIQRPDLAVQLLQDSIDNDPEVGEGWWRLASIYQMSMQDDKVIEVIEEARRLQVKFSKNEEKTISDILSKVKTSEIK